MASVAAASVAMGAMFTPQQCSSGFCVARSRPGNPLPRACDRFPRPSTHYFCCYKSSIRPLLSGHQRSFKGMKVKLRSKESIHARWHMSSYDVCDLLRRSHAIEQLGCISCSRGQLRRHFLSYFSASRVSLLKETSFSRKQFFGGTNADRMHIPCATVGSDEPHATSMTCPDTISERGALWIPEREKYDLNEFLKSQLPSHPKLHRGQLKNGLRYLILPNKVPANSSGNSELLEVQF